MTAKGEVEFTPAGVGDEVPVASPDEATWVDAGAVLGGTHLDFYQVLGRNCDGTTSYP